MSPTNEQSRINTFGGRDVTSVPDITSSLRCRVNVPITYSYNACALRQNLDIPVGSVQQQGQDHTVHGQVPALRG